MNVVKPHRNEALIRLRSSLLCLVGVTVVTFLSPLPSLPSALFLWIRDDTTSDLGDELASILKMVAGIELGVVAVLLVTILQAWFAIKFPRESTPLSSKTPLKPTKSTTTSRRIGPLSPHTSPQPQKTYSPNISLSRSNLGSSTPATPSPLAAYAGKHADAGLGRSLDGSFIRRLEAEVSDDED